MSKYVFPIEPEPFGLKQFKAFMLWAKNEIGANDIYLETDEPLGIKKDNVTYNVTEALISYEEICIIISEIYQDSAPAELRSGETLDFTYSLPYGCDEVLRFRVNATSCNSLRSSTEGIEIVFRPTDGAPPKASDIGVDDELLAFTNYTEGLVLVTGPTGSGKTTLIGSILRHAIETQRKHIITAEEPVEYDYKLIPNRLSRVVQSEVPINIKSFSLSVSNALRRSPDIILMGELRGPESIEGGLLAAQTGHLVFATGHTNNVESSLERLADEFDHKEKRSKLFKLIDSIKAIVHQRLLAKRGGGRIAIQSRLLLTTQIKMALYARMNQEGGEGVADIIKSFVESDGVTLKSSILDAFSNGQLDIETCISQLIDDVQQEDLEFLRTQTGLLVEKGQVTEAEAIEWLTYIESCMRGAR